MIVFSLMWLSNDQDCLFWYTKFIYKWQTNLNIAIYVISIYGPEALVLCYLQLKLPVTFLHARNTPAVQTDREGKVVKV